MVNEIRSLSSQGNVCSFDSNSPVIGYSTRPNTLLRQPSCDQVSFGAKIKFSDMEAFLKKLGFIIRKDTGSSHFKIMKQTAEGKEVPVHNLVRSRADKNVLSESVSSEIAKKVLGLKSSGELSSLMADKRATKRFISGFSIF